MSCGISELCDVQLFVRSIQIFSLLNLLLLVCCFYFCASCPVFVTLYAKRRNCLSHESSTMMVDVKYENLV